MVRFIRSMNDVFNVDESSELLSTSSNRTTSSLRSGDVPPNVEFGVWPALKIGLNQPFQRGTRSHQCLGNQRTSKKANALAYRSWSSRSIVSSRLEHLAVQSRWTKDATDDLLVEIKSVRNDKRELQKIHSARHVTNEGQSVSVASASDDGRRPETGPDFDRREDPSGAALAADERVELIRLKLFDSDSRDRLATALGV